MKAKSGARMRFRFISSLSAAFAAEPKRSLARIVSREAATGRSASRRAPLAERSFSSYSPTRNS
jgi:hypothetical protein